jgi:transcriptional regulator with XRE-family HTH domain
VRTSTWDGERFKITIEAIRTAAGLTPAELSMLATTMGISRSQFSRWANGHNRPTFDALTSFVQAITAKYPAVSELASELLLSAGYGDQAAPAAADLSPQVAVIRLRAVAGAEGKTIGEILTEHGVDADELVIPDALPLDPIIAEIEAEDLPEETKARLIKIYLDRRAEIFEAERLRVERERAARERQPKPERTKPGA